MLESTVIVGKLKEEGINEALGNGLQFEDETGLNAWVDAYKSGLPQPVKGLNDYTREELEEIARDPQFKGAKGLQGLLDKFRQAKNEPPKNEPSKGGNDEVISKLEALEKKLIERDEADKLNAEKSKALAEIKKTFDKQGDIDIIMLKVGNDFTKVGEAIKEHQAYLTSMMPNYVPKKSAGKTGDLSALAAEYKKTIKTKK